MEKQQLHASVTAWISDLKQGDSDAARQLWDRYFDRLTRLASRRLGNASRRIADEEDVAIDVFQSLCNGAEQGRFTQLGNREDLWKLLVAISGMKAVDQIRRETAQKRGSGDVRGHSIIDSPGETGLGAGFDRFLDAEPTPEFLVTLDEEKKRLFSLLADDSQREVARLRLEGFSNNEIADQLGIALRSVERKIKVVRETWTNALEPTGI